MPFDPQSFNKTLLRTNSILGFGEFAIYHAQLLQIEAKPVYLRGHGTRSAECLLNNLVGIERIFKQHRQVILDSISRNRL